MDRKYFHRQSQGMHHSMNPVRKEFAATKKLKAFIEQLEDVA